MDTSSLSSVMTLYLSVGLFTLIVFLIMAVAVHNISQNTKKTNEILRAWAKQYDWGEEYQCNKCMESYLGKLPACPRCGDKKDYTT